MKLETAQDNRLQPRGTRIEASPCGAPRRNFGLAWWPDGLAFKPAPIPSFRLMFLLYPRAWACIHGSSILRIRESSVLLRLAAPRTLRLVRPRMRPRRSPRIAEQTCGFHWPARY